MPSGLSIAHAKFKTRSPDREFEVQFNPVSLEHAITNQLQGEGGQSSQYVSSSTAKISLELIFDTTETGVDVRSKTIDIARLMQPAGGDQGSDAERRAPPVVSFEWGSFEFRGMVESFKETMDFFSADGVPLRASVQISMSAQESVFERLGRDIQSDVGGGLQLPGGDPSSLATAGGAPGAARGIAAANDLESLRFGGGPLSVGGGVSLKPPAAFAAGGGAGLSLGIGGGVAAGVGGSLSAGVSAAGGAFSALCPEPNEPSLSGLDPRKLLAALPTAARNSTQFDLSGRALTQGGSPFQSNVGAKLKFDNG